MLFSLKHVSLGLAAFLGIASWVQSKDDTTILKPSSETTAALAAPEFVDHLDVDAAVAAFRADDADALLAIGNKLGQAELTLGKPNAPMPSAAFYRMAISINHDNHDLKRLDQLATTIREAKHLSKSDQEKLLAELAIAQEFSSGARKIDAGPGVKPNEVSPEAISLYQTFVREIRITQNYGTEEELTQLVDGIKQLRELHPKQREHLSKLATTARVAIQERDGADPAIMKLAAVSRNIQSGLRILGPGTVAADGTVTLVIIATNPEGKKPGQIHFRSSPGTKVPEALAWSGVPLLVPTIIKTRPGTRVFVSAGLNANANMLSWNAQVARE